MLINEEGGASMRAKMGVVERIRTRSESSLSELRMERGSKTEGLGLEEVKKGENILLEKIKERSRKGEIEEENREEAKAKLLELGEYKLKVLLEDLEKVCEYVKNKIGSIRVLERRASVSWQMQEEIKEEVENVSTSSGSVSESESIEERAKRKREEEEKKEEERKAAEEKVAKRKERIESPKVYLGEGKLKILGEAILDRETEGLEGVFNGIRYNILGVHIETQELREILESTYRVMGKNLGCGSRRALKIYGFLLVEAFSKLSGREKKISQIRKELIDYIWLYEEYEYMELEKSAEVKRLCELVSMNIVLLNSKQESKKVRGLRVGRIGRGVIEELKEKVKHVSTKEGLTKEIIDFLQLGYGKKAPELLLDTGGHGEKKIKVCDEIRKTMEAIKGVSDEDSVRNLVKIVLSQYDENSITLRSILPKAYESVKYLRVCSLEEKAKTEQVEARSRTQSNASDYQKRGKLGVESKDRIEWMMNSGRRGSLNAGRNRSDLLNSGRNRSDSMNSGRHRSDSMNSGRNRSDSMTSRRLKYEDFKIEEHLSGVDFVYRVKVPKAGYFIAEHKCRNIHKIMRWFMKQPIMINDSYDEDCQVREIITTDTKHNKIFVCQSNISAVLKKRGPLIAIIDSDPVLIIGVCSTNDTLIVITPEDLRLKILPFSEWNKNQSQGTEVKVPFVLSGYHDTYLAKYLKTKILYNPNRNLNESTFVQTLTHSIMKSFGFGVDSDTLQDHATQHTNLMRFFSNFYDSKLSFIPLDIRTGKPTHTISSYPSDSSIHGDIALEMRQHVSNINQFMKHISPDVHFQCVPHKKNIQCFCAQKIMTVSAVDDNMNMFNKRISDINTALDSFEHTYRINPCMLTWNTKIFIPTCVLVLEAMDVPFHASKLKDVSPLHENDKHRYDVSHAQHITRTPSDNSLSRTSSNNSLPRTPSDNSLPRTPSNNSVASTCEHTIPSFVLSDVTIHNAIVNFIHSAQSLGLPVIK